MFTKKGLSPEILDSMSYQDHISKAMNSLFPLAMDTPLPAEITRSLEFMKTTDPKLILQFWDVQLNRLDQLIMDCSAKQSEWFQSAPKGIEGAQSRFQSVAYRQLLSQAGLGGEKWVTQMIFGFPTTGCFSQCVTFPQSDKFKAPAPLSVIWKRIPGGFENATDGRVLKMPRNYGRRLCLR